MTILSEQELDEETVHDLQKKSVIVINIQQPSQNSRDLEMEITQRNWNFP